MPLIKAHADISIKDRCLDLDGVFTYIHTLWLQAAKACLSLQICAGWPDPWMLAHFQKVIMLQIKLKDSNEGSE